IKISVLALNDKFILKLEYDLLEQVYKIRNCDEISNFGTLEELVDEKFLESCIKRFNEMNKDLYDTFERNNIM
ncbi:MAG TPA: hypothetical protein PLV71_10085, partial [Chitinophagales bacterium]|nr:hypothetical protein [Chitinophagales bacterium]